MLLQDKTEATNWASDEFHTVSFSDERLNQRLIKMTNQFSAQPMAPINQACDDWADTKAAYRFFDNPKVTASHIWSPHLIKLLEKF
jgi:hypothetical protein